MTIDYRAPPLEQQITLLARTLPDGRLWNAKYDRTRVFGRLLAALAPEIGRTYALIADFVLRELDPSKTRQLLLEWEESVGIPDACFDRSADLAERQRRVVQKLNNFGGIITRADIEGILEDFGEAIQLVPGNAGNAQLLGFPAPPYDTNQLKQIKHTLAVRVASDAPVFPLPFPFQFAGEQSSLLQCLVRRITPANVALQFFFNANLSQPLGGPDSIAATHALGAPTQSATVVVIAEVSAANVVPAPTQAATLEVAVPAPAVVILDAWTNESEAIATPGSKVVSAGSNRLLLARTSPRGDPLRTVTGVTYGGQAMTLVEQETSTGGPDLHTALWRLGETGIAAASGTAFGITSDNATGVQFRLQAASYQNVDQTTPVVNTFSSASVLAGDDPIASALTTVDGGVAIETIGINQGSAAGVAASFSNMTERLEVAADNSHHLIGEVDTDGTSFTATLSTTHASRSHLLGVSLRPAP